MTARLAALRASLAADALSLGPHWVYNQAKLARTYPNGVHTYDNPQSSYHPNRSAGQFTHYGDQSLCLLRSLTLRRGWSLEGFREDWRQLWPTYDGFLDGATKETLQHLEAGSLTASGSNDLAGASRMAPLLVALADQPLEDKIAAARAQTAMTHGDPAVAEAAEFFVRATEAVLAGATVPDALHQAAAANYEHLAAADDLAKATEAAGLDDPLAAASAFGLTCHLPEAFPATLLFLLRHPGDLRTALSENCLAGGDNSARGMLIGLVLGAALGPTAIPYDWIDQLAATAEIDALLTLLQNAAPPVSQPLSFTSADGNTLDARLELPSGPVRATALFAHCFTCGKNSRAAVHIARSLATHGIATLRFDFTGLGSSEGDFANSSFLTNVQDLVAAADHLRDHHQAPTLLVGHSLGGAAVLAAAGQVPECRGVVTIGAPADPAHVTHLLGDGVEEIREKGEAEISLAGRPFRIGQRFLDDLEEACQPCAIAKLQRDLLVMHAPEDSIVGIDNARRIYESAKHPKSFVSLDRADHLLTDPAASRQAAEIIAAWASRLS